MAMDYRVDSPKILLEFLSYFKTSVYLKEFYRIIKTEYGIDKSSQNFHKIISTHLLTVLTIVVIYII